MIKFLFAITPLPSQWSPTWVIFMGKIQSIRQTANKPWFTLDNIENAHCIRIYQSDFFCKWKRENHHQLPHFLSFLKQWTGIICQKKLRHEHAQISTSHRWWEVWLLEISSFWECAVPKRHVISSSTPGVKCLHMLSFLDLKCEVVEVQLTVEQQ